MNGCTFLESGRFVGLRSTSAPGRECEVGNVRFEELQLEIFGGC